MGQNSFAQKQREAARPTTDRDGESPVPEGSCDSCMYGLTGPGIQVQCGADREWRLGSHRCALYRPEFSD